MMPQYSSHSPSPRGLARPGRPFRPLRHSLVALLLAGTALGGYAAGHGGFAAEAPVATAPAAGQPAGPAAGPIADFSDLVARVKPAVVSITTKLEPRTAADEGPMQQFGQMPPHRTMPDEGMPPMQHPRMMEARGSGFIVDASGIIVTNNHVVKDAQTVSVTLDDGTELPARVIGHDSRTDIAVLRVDAGHPLPHVELGDSGALRPGEWVIAMGNPFGLGGSVTAGIVSARGRDIGEGPYDNFIQVDAPINQGNSGGPLFTQNGKVVGVNTAILSPSGGSIGIGFAIPSSMVKTVVAQLESTGHVVRGYLGVAAQPVAGDMAAALNLPKTAGGQTKGALVASVEPNSPAARAGLQPGDVIEAVDGKTLAGPRDLAVDIAAIAPGADTSLGILRNGHEQTVSVHIATLPNQQDASAQGGEAAGQPRLGLALQPLSPELRDQLDVPAGAQGVVIAGVAADSPAAQAGIEPGDVLLGVGTQDVDSPQTAVRAIRKAVQAKHAVALRVMRHGQAAFIALDLPKPAPHDDQG
jgi:serine protease Do